MIKKMILIIVIVGSGLIFFTNKAKASESYSYDNLASPDLSGKEYLGNGVYRINQAGISYLDYNIYNGLFTVYTPVNSGPAYIFHLPQDTYTITVESDNNNQTFYLAQNGNEFYFNQNDGGQKRTYTFENMVTFAIVRYEGGNELTSFTLQIEKGDTATPYTVPIQALEQHTQLEKEKSYNAGLDDGWWMGYDDGLDDGYADGYADGLDDGYNGYDIEYARVNPESDNTEWFEMQFSYKYSNWYSHLGDIAEMVNNDLSDGVGTYEKWIRWYFNSGIETNFLITFSSLTVDQVVLPESGFIQLYVKVEKDEHSYQVNFFTFGETSVYSYRDTDVVTNSYNFIYKTRLYDEGIEMYEGGYNNGYDDGYFEGKQLYGVGYNEGYNKGISESIESGGFSMILSSMFTSVGVLLSVELLPNISIGSIVAIPIVFGVIMFIIGRKKE